MSFLIEVKRNFEETSPEDENDNKRYRKEEEEGSTIIVDFIKSHALPEEFVKKMDITSLVSLMNSSRKTQYILKLRYIQIYYKELYFDAISTYFNEYSYFNNIPYLYLSLFPFLNKNEIQGYISDFDLDHPRDITLTDYIYSIKTYESTSKLDYEKQKIINELITLVENFEKEFSYLEPQIFLKKFHEFLQEKLDIDYVKLYYNIINDLTPGLNLSKYALYDLSIYNNLFIINDKDEDKKNPLFKYFVLVHHKGLNGTKWDEKRYIKALKIYDDETKKYYIKVKDKDGQYVGVNENLFILKPTMFRDTNRSFSDYSIRDVLNDIEISIPHKNNSNMEEFSMFSDVNETEGITNDFWDNTNIEEYFRIQIFGGQYDTEFLIENDGYIFIDLNKCINIFDTHDKKLNIKKEYEFEIKNTKNYSYFNTNTNSLIFEQQLTLKVINKISKVLIFELMFKNIPNTENSTIIEFDKNLSKDFNVFYFYEIVLLNNSKFYLKYMPDIRLTLQPKFVID